MILNHLPTLDGTVEASVARLEALSRRHDTDTLETLLWEAQNIVDCSVELVSTSRDCQEQASQLRHEHESVLNRVQNEIDRLVSA